MTMRERVLAVLDGRLPERMPWLADLSYWMASQKTKGELPEKYIGEEGYAQFHRELGVGLYLYTPSVYTTKHDESDFEVSNYEEGEHKIREIKAPEGTLRTVQKYCPDSFSTAIVEYGAKTAKDIPAVVAIAESVQFEPRYEDFQRVDALWGDDGIPLTLPPRTPLAKFVVEHAGLINTTFIAEDAPREFEKALERMRRAEDRVYEIICDSPAELVEIPDNLSSEAVGGLFRRYSFDYYVQRVKQLHAAGKKVGVHLDGTIAGLLPQLAATGLDWVESLVPAPVGDVAVEDLRAYANETLVLWGGVPGAMFGPAYTPDQVLEHVRRILEVHGSAGRFILASADQVPPDGDIELVRMIADFVNDCELT